jgi:uridine phosphorylase
MKFFKLVVSGLWIFLASTALAGSEGFYADTFDPPTKTQLGRMRCALGDQSVSTECQEKVSRIVVSVTEDPEQDTLASTRERILMVRKALQPYGDRVEVVASPPPKEEQRRRALLEDNSIELSGEFSDPEAISSTAVQSEIQAREATNVLLDDPVREIIEKLGLYQEVPKDLADLQKSLFQEGWKDFVTDLNLACRNLISDQGCNDLARRWAAVSIVADEAIDQRDPKRLVYKKFQSENRWAEKFSQTAMQSLPEPEYYDKFKPVADDIAGKIFRGYYYGKLPHLKRILFETKGSPAEPLNVTEKPITCAAFPGSYDAYNMDIHQYIADRFPRAFADFLKRQLRSGSISPEALYVHNHSIEQAYEFHRRDQFDSFYYLQTRRGQLHRNIYLAVRSMPLAYRVVFTDVRGNDREVNVLCQIHGAAIFSHYQSVQSRQAQPLFVLNAKGTALQLDENDLVFFGFKGNWMRMLLAQNWRQIPLVQEGLDIDLFTHPAISQKIVVARNAYGEDAATIVDALYQKGARQVIYLGTAGAIADYQVGDVVIPKEFVDLNNRPIPFYDNLAHCYRSGLSSVVTIHGAEKHVSVRTVFDETKPALIDWQAKSVGSVDVEGAHLARFALSHRDLKMALLFVISDQTLGAHTIEQSNAHRRLIDLSVDKLMAFLLPKALSTN